MEEYGQFNVINNKKVECEFPCPHCNETIKIEFLIRSEKFYGEEAGCPKCHEVIYLDVRQEVGSGTVGIPALKDQRMVKAQGLP